MERSRKFLQLTTFTSTFCLLLFAQFARAQVSTGDVITSDAVAKVKDLVSPGVYQQIANGMAIKVVDPQLIEWPPPYKAATEKYSAQVHLSSDGKTPVGYVAGLPFPTIDANDPAAATKLMWNFEFRPLYTDDYDLRFLDCEFAYLGGEKNGQTLESLQVGHYAGMSFVGRTESDPVPTDPDFQVSGRIWAFALYPVLTPAELAGGGLVRHRFADPSKPDVAWAYNPETRRIRELDETSLMNPSGIGAYSPDHFSGLNAKLEDYSYKFLGEKPMLASFHAVSPEQNCMSGAQCADPWEMRKLYLVEVTPVRNTAMFDAGAKMVVYIDSETFSMPYMDMYKGGGVLDQSEIYWFGYDDRTMPSATVAVYPFKRQFLTAAQSFEADNSIATKCFLPGADSPDTEGWYINAGSNNNDFFTADAMVKAAR